MKSVKTILRQGLLLVGMSLPGWFSVKADTILPAVGPAPVIPAGELIVYSATVPSLAEAGAEFDWAENRNLHTNYTIYDRNGSVYRNVLNSFGPNDENAKVVRLPVGKYTVRAMSQKDGWVLVPVVIKAGTLTTVNLESSTDSTQQNIPKNRAVLTPSRPHRRLAGRERSR